MKMIFAILFSSILLSTTAYAQVNRVVDAKRGFKDFKLGDPKSKWTANLVFDKTVGTMKMYRYNGPCCQQVFDSQAEKILLGFSDVSNKLVAIYISTPTRPYKWLEGYLEYYEHGFKEMFGEPQHTEHKPVPGKNLECWTYTWYGSDCSIDLRAYYGPTENGEMYSEVYVLDKAYVMNQSSKKSSSGF
ncbi:hypothetical protein [Hymenobacter nivis]|uniref:hypothetical protein n=1 Tax=Hymenobacter nivis TaxID=1850093 RepID=UPI0013A5BAA7|nr:hypothetical protein [Hymenobacter nivis]